MTASAAVSAVGLITRRPWLAGAGFAIDVVGLPVAARRRGERGAWGRN